MPYLDDAQALGTLRDNFSWKQGVIRTKVFGYAPTSEERNAISYLVCNWDYAYESKEPPEDIDTPGEVLDAWEEYVSEQKPGFPWILTCWALLFLIAVGLLAAAVAIHS